MTITLDSKVPEGPLADKWQNYIANQKLVNPSNKRKFKIIVVGTGLAGASAAATLGELGYQVEAFTFHDSPRRAHSIAAQGGINAAKNYQGDGDSIPGSSTTPSRAATSTPEKQTCTGSPKFRSTSSTRWSPRACRSPANTAGCSTTAASVVPRSAARSTPAVGPGSSCCSALLAAGPRDRARQVKLCEPHGNGRRRQRRGPMCRHHRP